jgi:hypothetical protein
MNTISRFVCGTSEDGLTMPFNHVEAVMDELMERVGIGLDRLDG